MSVVKHLPSLPRFDPQDINVPRTSYQLYICSRLYGIAKCTVYTCTLLCIFEDMHQCYSCYTEMLEFTEIFT